MAAVGQARILLFASQPPKGFKCFLFIRCPTSERLKIQKLLIQILFNRFNALI
jgi:hypothetical protein